MHEVVKEFKDDEADYYLRVSPAVAMHEVVKELKDDEVEAVARHVPHGHGGHASVQPGNAVLFHDLLHTLARSVVIASRCCCSHTTERGDGHSCPHNHTTKELSFSSSFCTSRQFSSNWAQSSFFLPLDNFRATRPRDPPPPRPLPTIAAIFEQLGT